MGEVILITSGKGGTGKTSLCASIGALLASLDKKVMLIDMDFGLRNLDVVTGLENFIFNNAFDVIKEKTDLKDALLQSKDNENMFILPAPQTKNADSITEDEFKTFINKVKDDFDYILIDSPAGIGMGFTNLISSATRVIVVTTPEVMSVRDADKVVSILKSKRVFNINILINRVRTDLEGKTDLVSVNDIEELIAADIIGVIPEDNEAYLLINHGETFEKSDSPAGKCLIKTVKRLLGEEIPLTVFGQEKGFFVKFAHIFKRKR